MSGHASRFPGCEIIPLAFKPHCVTKATTPSVCEEATYRSLYEEHMTPVRNFAYYKTGDLDRAADIAQESFVRLWEKCSDVALETAKGFLLTVANRLFLNETRHKKVQLKFQMATGNRTNEESPEFVMEEAEFKEALETAISQLSEKQREVFLMNRIDKMSYPEIAKVLDISVKAVEKRMGAALRTLKDQVKALNQHKF